MRRLRRQMSRLAHTVRRLILVDIRATAMRPARSRKPIMARKLTHRRLRIMARRKAMLRNRITAHSATTLRRPDIMARRKATRRKTRKARKRITVRRAVMRRRPRITARPKATPRPRPMVSNPTTRTLRRANEAAFAARLIISTGLLRSRVCRH